MKVNFDGMRRNATSSMNDLHRVIESIIENDHILDSEKEELIEAFNYSAESVDVFNILSDDADENFNDLDIEINRLEEIE